MHVQSIKDSASVFDTSTDGRQFNRVMLHCDEYLFLVEKAKLPNAFEGNYDEFYTLDYHGEFLPLVAAAEGAQ